MGSLLNLVLTLVVSFALCLDDVVQGTSDNFYFSQDPKFPDNVVDGQRLSVACRVSEEDHIIYHWLFNDKILGNTTRRYQTQSGLNFDIVYRGRDAGQYHCVAQNVSSGYSLTSSPADLKIGWMGTAAKVVMLSPKSNRELHEGNSLVLQCVVEGSGFQVQWYRNAFRVLSDTRVLVDEREHTLNIATLSVTDNGVYSCEVSNGASTVVSQRTFPLVIARADIASARVIPQDLTISRYSPAWFDCVYENARRVEWFNKHDQETPIRNSTKGPVILPNGTLYFAKVKNSDEGGYRCVGVMNERDLEDAPSLGYIAELRLMVRPEITRTSLIPVPTADNKYILPAGATLEAFCRAKPTARPEPVFSWVNSTGAVVSDGPFWLIESLQPKHAGNYVCRAHNGYGSAEEYTVTLIVTILPVISQEPETSITVDEQSKIQLFCAFKGSPGPLTTITWARRPSQSNQYHPITASLRHFVTGRPTSSQLVVNQTVAEEDSGNYRCQVTTLGFAPVYSELAAVTIRERLKFTVKPLSQHLEFESKAKILCRAHASDKVKIRWTKLTDGETVTDLPSHVRAFGNGTLAFDGVQKSDRGAYLCTAWTSTETVNATINVEVVVAPKFTIIPADSVVFVGQTLVLDCQAVGEPEPNVQWDKEGKSNSTESLRWTQLKNGSIVIVNVRPVDGGHYGCTAGNKGGLKRLEVELTVQQESNTSVTHTIIITVSCASGYMILVVALVIYCKRKRSRKSEPEANPLTTLMTPEMIIQTSYSIAPESTVLLPKQPRHPPSLASSAPNTLYDRQNSSVSRRTVSNQSHLYESAPVGYATGSDDPRHSPNTSSAYSSAVHSNGKSGTNISRQRLNKMNDLGRGQFGEVFTADFVDNSATYLVAVKVLKTRAAEDVNAFHKEYSMYRKFNHANVVQCLGLCQRTATQPEWTVYEHTKAGNLRSFLDVNSEHVTHAHRVSIARQIAGGMQHISQHRYVHRDLAARNCVVDVLANYQLLVKVGNLSLTSDSYFQADYVAQRNRLLPLRWMPGEAFLEDEFSVKSDIWSFGVVCYEVLCRGTPYSGLDDGEVVERLQCRTLRLIEDYRGVIAEERCLMEKCTAWNPAERPTFDDIVEAWPLRAHDG